MPLFDVVKPTQVADVVEQRAHGAELEQAFAHDQRTGRARTAIHQPRHRQRHFKNVLDVVVFGLAGVIAGKLAAVEASDIGKRRATARTETRGGRAVRRSVRSRKETGSGSVVSTWLVTIARGVAPVCRERKVDQAA